MNIQGANYHVNNRVNSESTHSAFGFGGGLLTGAALGGPVGANYWRYAGRINGRRA